MTIALDEQKTSRCAGCGQMIDPDICWCGEPEKNHYYANHAFVPMGCDCYRDDANSETE